MIATSTSWSISDGKVLAHGSNAKFVGKDLIDAQDVDGKLYVKERVEIAGKQPTFWQDYKFVNPVARRSSRSRCIARSSDNTAVCAGIYKFSDTQALRPH